MTLEELKTLVAEGESLTVEFKSDERRLRDSELVESLAAMSNAQGGTLLLGVEDDGRITGLCKCHFDVAGIVPLVENRTEPNLTVSVERLLVDGAYVGVVKVGKSRQIVSTSDGKYLRRRIGPDCKPQVVAVRPADIISRQSSLGLLDPSAIVLEGVSVEELDPLQRIRLRQFIDNYNGDRALASLPDAHLDAALGLCVESAGSLHPTVAGLLLLGTEALLRKHVPAHEAAFQVLSGTRVKVNHFSRNPLLADVVKRIGLAERTGRGIDRIYEGVLRYGRPAPDFSASNSATVSVTMANVPANRQFVRMLQSRPDHGVGLEADVLLEMARVCHDDGTDSLDVTLKGERSAFNQADSSEAKILAFVDKHGAIAVRQVEVLCNLSRKRAKTILGRLCGAGKLLHEIKSRYSRYVAVQTDEQRLNVPPSTGPFPPSTGPFPPSTGPFPPSTGPFPPSTGPFPPSTGLS